MKINTLVLGTAMVLLSGCAYGTQLLTNPGFETGLFSPWTNDNSIQAGSWTVISSGCHSGTYCVTVGSDVGLEQLFSGVGTVNITSANFWVNPTNAVFVQLLYQGGGVSNFIFNPTGVQKGVWDQVDLMSNLTPGAILVGIEVFGYSGFTTTVDDLSIVGTAPEPGAFWLLAAGIGTLGALARRKGNVRNRS